VNEEVFQLELPADEALVLFEFQSRFSDHDRLDIVDRAEEEVLWGLQGSLEKRLAEPFLPDYQDRLRRARARLRHESV
jgi:hypothetical protein